MEVLTTVRDATFILLYALSHVFVLNKTVKRAAVSGHEVH